MVVEKERALYIEALEATSPAGVAAASSIEDPAMLREICLMARSEHVARETLIRIRTDADAMKEIATTHENMGLVELAMQYMPHTMLIDVWNETGDQKRRWIAVNMLNLRGV